jgi:hypothetical protein
MVRAAALLVLFAGSLSAAPMTLYVDKDGKGGPCSDSYPRTENDAAHPWCTLGQAGIGANTPSDTVLVRSSAHPYSEVQTCWDAASGMACGGWAVLEPQHKGTASAPITFKSYPGEQAVIDPDGKVPSAGSGLVYGLMVGGSREPDRCSGGARPALTCQDNSMVVASLTLIPEEEIDPDSCVRVLRTCFTGRNEIRCDSEWGPVLGVLDLERKAVRMRHFPYQIEIPDRCHVVQEER